MKLFGALILFMTLSAVCGLRCYVCAGYYCRDEADCPVTFDRCSTTDVNGYITKTCTNNAGCTGNTKCCSTDLCNSATPTGSSILLLLVSSGIITLFL
ncbi:lymphocyte antigen 6D-like [Plectropomus leopardus]|uniref:lymphocyte antigen 6D-like n=1 Tax=Plectropomus leopardus TaxID=160734 RepID=UPI001C4CBB8B|nr:lymphocyte antigen 6D-like [Plectropomus leopardus]